MGQGIPQLSFTAGELAPAMYGRGDINRFYSGARKVLNFIVRPYGGLSNRTGTTFVADLGGPCRLIPFQFSTVQTYTLAFGEYTMRVFTNGGQVLYPVGHASAGQPVVITTIYPYSALARLKFTQNADVMTLCHPDYPPQQLSRLDHHSWNFAPFANTGGPFLDINIDESKTIYASAFTGSTTITASSSLFTSDMVGQMMRIEQAPNSLTNKWEVQKTIQINDKRRAGANYYEAVNAGTTGTVRPSTLEGVEPDGDPGVTWRYLHSGFGIVLITGYTSPTVVTGTVLSRLPDSVITGSLVRTITGVTAGTEPVEDPPTPGVNARVTCPAHGFSTGDSLTISGVTGMTGINGIAQIIVVDANTYDLSGIYGSGAYAGGGVASKTLAATLTYKWALEAWGGNQDYPSATTYYQQRQAFAASLGKPQATWFSRTKGYLDFGTETPALSDDSISFTVASREVQEIRHIVELSELILLTSGGAWTMMGQDGVLTPSSVNVKRQGAIGCSHVPPAIIGSYALFVSEKGSQIRSLGYNFQQDAFIGQDLTVLSHHLFTNKTVVDMVFQQLPYSCIWAVRNDGVLLGLTYLPEQDVAGWHQHTTQGSYRSVCCVSEGSEDALYQAVDRVVGGVTKYYLERAVSRTAAIPCFLDSALTYSGDPVSVVSGLSHLEGKTVGVMADGVYVGTKVVAGGSITLTTPASIIVVGLLYTSELETLDLSSAQNNIRTTNKLMNHVSILVDESKNVMAGPDANNLMEYQEDLTLVQQASDLVDIRIPGSWSKTARILVRQEKPLPLTVLAVIPDVSSGGN